MSEKDAGDGFIPYDLPRLSAEEMIAKSKAFAEELETRRSVRVFSKEPIPLGGSPPLHRCRRHSAFRRTQTTMDLLPGH